VKKRETADDIVVSIYAIPPYANCFFFVKQITHKLKSSRSWYQFCTLPPV